MNSPRATRSADPSNEILTAVRELHFEQKVYGVRPDGIPAHDSPWASICAECSTDTALGALEDGSLSPGEQGAVLWPCATLDALADAERRAAGMPTDDDLRESARPSSTNEQTELTGPTREMVLAAAVALHAARLKVGKPTWSELPLAKQQLKLRAAAHALAAAEAARPVDSRIASFEAMLAYLEKELRDEPSTKDSLHAQGWKGAMTLLHTILIDVPGVRAAVVPQPATVEKTTKAAPQAPEGSTSDPVSDSALQMTTPGDLVRTAMQQRKWKTADLVSALASRGVSVEQEMAGRKPSDAKTAVAIEKALDKPGLAERLLIAQARRAAALAGGLMDAPSPERAALGKIIDLCEQWSSGGGLHLRSGAARIRNIAHDEGLTP